MHVWSTVLTSPDLKDRVKVVRRELPLLRWDLPRLPRKPAAILTTNTTAKIDLAGAWDGSTEAYYELPSTHVGAEHRREPPTSNRHNHARRDMDGWVGFRNLPSRIIPTNPPAPKKKICSRLYYYCTCRWRLHAANNIQWQRSEQLILVYSLQV